MNRTCNEKADITLTFYEPELQTFFCKRPLRVQASFIAAVRLRTRPVAIYNKKQFGSYGSIKSPRVQRSLVGREYTGKFLLPCILRKQFSLHIWNWISITNSVPWRFREGWIVWCLGTYANLDMHAPDHRHMFSCRYSSFTWNFQRYLKISEIVQTQFRWVYLVKLRNRRLPYMHAWRNLKVDGSSQSI
jgi:hypothetical protein